MFNQQKRKYQSLVVVVFGGGKYPAVVVAIKLGNTLHSLMFVHI